jgi:hypothetical protein
MLGAHLQLPRAARALLLPAPRRVFVLIISTSLFLQRFPPSKTKNAQRQSARARNRAPAKTAGCVIITS